MFTKTKIDDQSHDEILVPNWQLLMIFVIINILISLWAHRLIFTREFYYALLSDQMAFSRIDHLVSVLDGYSYLTMILIPIGLFIRFLASTLLLQLMMLIKFIEIKFSRLFRLVMVSSLMLSAGQIMHYLWIYFSPQDHSSRTLLQTKPYSLASLVETNEYPPSSLFVLNQSNLFEILWMGCIFWGLVRTNRMKNTDAAMFSFILWSSTLFLHWAVYFFIEKLQ